MNLIEKIFGIEEVDKVWAEMTETNGTGFDSWLASKGLVDIVLEASHGKVYLDAQNNIISSDNLIRTPELRKLIVTIIDTSQEADEASTWLSRLSGVMGEGSIFHYWAQQIYGDDVFSKVGDLNPNNLNDNWVIVNPITDSDRRNVLFGLTGNDSIYGATARDDLYGGLGNDELHGNKGADQIFGGIGDDKLYGGEQNDYLNGGLGNDILNGGVGDDLIIDDGGNDTYLFEGNFGHDIISDLDGSGLIKIDGLVLSAGERVNDDEWKSADGIYTFSVISDSDGVANFYNLVITKNNDINNSITIKSWNNGDLGINLSDFGQKKVAAEGQYAFGNDGNNIIFNERYVASFGGNDLISSTNNNDVIISGVGNDLINSNDGDDFVSAGIGDDVVFAGRGRDTIYGEEGNDLILSSSYLSHTRNTYMTLFNKSGSTESQLTENFEGLDFKYEPILDENNRADSFYIQNNNITTYQILPLFNFYFNTPYGASYYIDILLSINWGGWLFWWGYRIRWNWG